MSSSRRRIIWILFVIAALLFLEAGAGDLYGRIVPAAALGLILGVVQLALTLWDSGVHFAEMGVPFGLGVVDAIAYLLLRNISVLWSVPILMVMGSSHSNLQTPIKRLVAFAAPPCSPSRRWALCDQLMNKAQPATH